MISSDDAGYEISKENRELLGGWCEKREREELRDYIFLLLCCVAGFFLK